MGLIYAQQLPVTTEPRPLHASEYYEIVPQTTKERKYWILAQTESWRRSVTNRGKHVMIKDN